MTTSSTNINPTFTIQVPNPELYDDIVLQEVQKIVTWVKAVVDTDPLQLYKVDGICFDFYAEGTEYRTAMPSNSLLLEEAFIKLLIRVFRVANFNVKRYIEHQTLKGFFLSRSLKLESK